MHQNSDKKLSLFHMDISDDDIYEAMKDIPGYLDITPGDLKEIYSHAYHHTFETIASSLTARALMTRNVYAVQRDTPLSEVADIMARNEISGVPVIDRDRHVLGVISEKDFCSHMGDLQAKSLMGIIADCIKHQSCVAMTIRKKAAEDLMTSPAITVQEDTALREITALLTEKNINRVPVIDQKGGLTGIVSRADIVRISFEKPN